MGEKFIETDIEHNKGYLYYIKKSDDNKIDVWRAKLGRGGRKKDVGNLRRRRGEYLETFDNRPSRIKKKYVEES